MPSRQLRGRQAPPPGRRRHAPPQFSCPPAYPRAGRIEPMTANGRPPMLDRRRRGRACTPRLLRPTPARRGPTPSTRAPAATSSSTTPTRCSTRSTAAACSVAAARHSRWRSSCAPSATPAARGRATVVLANGEEGEPASVKDRWLLRHRPHLVLDGVRLAARIVGAEHALTSTSPTRTPRTRSKPRWPSRADSAALPVTVVTVDAGYVAGEETAAVRAINGGPGQTDRQAAAPVRGGRRRLPDPGEQCRDAGQPAVHPAQHGADAFRAQRHVGLAGHLPRDRHRRRAGPPRSTNCRTALPFTDLLDTARCCRRSGARRADGRLLRRSAQPRRARRHARPRDDAPTRQRPRVRRRRRSSPTTARSRSRRR